MAASSINYLYCIIGGASPRLEVLVFELRGSRQRSRALEHFFQRYRLVIRWNLEDCVLPSRITAIPR